MNEMFDGLMDSLARHLGLETGNTLESPVELTIDDVTLTLAYDDRSTGDDLIMYASLGVVPQNQELFVYRAFLEGNLFWSGTADATIGVNSDTREALIAYSMPLEGLDGETLTGVAAHFVELARGWRGFVQAVGDQGEETATTPEFPPGMIKA